MNEDQLTETASGLRYADIAEGEGAPARAGDVVNVHYTGRLTDGSEFDSSRNRGPLSFRIGEGRVIPCWEEGLQGVRVGGKRLLVIPPGLAYGARGAPPVIPPNATLVFEVERVP